MTKKNIYWKLMDCLQIFIWTRDGPTITVMHPEIFWEYRFQQAILGQEPKSI